jgi:hypothetical protein
MAITYRHDAAMTIENVATRLLQKSEKTKEGTGGAKIGPRLSFGAASPVR